LVGRPDSRDEISNAVALFSGIFWSARGPHKKCQNVTTEDYKFMKDNVPWGATSKVRWSNFGGETAV